MSQFVFPPLTANLNSEASNGGSIPSSVLVVAGYDGANVRAIKTDSTGEVAVDVSSIGTVTVTGTVAVSAIAGALPAGSNAIGKLAANSGVDIGDVDVTSLPALPAGTNSIGTVILGAGTAAIGKLTANSGVDIGDVDVTSLPALPAGTNSIGTVILGAGTAAIGKLTANSGVDIGDVDVTSLPSIPAGTNSIGTVILGAGTAAIGKLTANSGVDIGDVDVTSLPALPAGTNSIGTVILGAGTAAIGKLTANSGVDIGDVDVTSLPSLPAGTNNIGDVDIASALPAGTNSIGTVVLGAGSASIGKLTAIAPVDFLDSGLVNTSTANIASTGTTVVSSLAAACTEIEIQEDIGEFMSIRVGGTVKAFLPLGGGRVKVSLAATDAVQLFSETGTAISSGKIAINFLG